jgi:hypothetical protein
LVAESLNSFLQKVPMFLVKEEVRLSGGVSREGGWRKLAVEVVETGEKRGERRDWIARED